MNYRAVQKPFSEFWEVQRRLGPIWFPTEYRVLTQADAQNIIDRITTPKVIWPTPPKV